jgi:hypothetical protein
MLLQKIVYSIALLVFSASVFANPTILEVEDTDNRHGSTVKATLLVDRVSGYKSLAIDYTSDLNTCNNSGDVSPIDLDIIFVLGEGADAQSYRYPISTFCPNRGTKASFRFNSKDGLSMPSWMGKSDPYIWDRLFPKNSNGERWYALRVAFVKSHRGTNYVWDNKGGEDYRLVLPDTAE